MGRDRVMAEMRDTGLVATELGPDGYLPTDPGELDAYLESYGLHVVAGFVPALLYRPERIEQELDYVQRAAHQLAGVGSTVLVLGATSHLDGYDTSVNMSDAEWEVFLVNLARLEEVVTGAGLLTALHPHWGMAIETDAHVERLLETCDVGLCLDTGHLYLGGADPVAIAQLAASRIHHVHLKDVDAGFAARVRSGTLGFRQAVIDGMFTRLGEGDVEIAGVVRTLEQAGYRGWYVIEQDKSLAAEPPFGEGPYADAAASVEYLRKLASVGDGDD